MLQSFSQRKTTSCREFEAAGGESGAGGVLPRHVAKAVPGGISHTDHARQTSPVVAEALKGHLPILKTMMAPFSRGWHCACEGTVPVIVPRIRTGTVPVIVPVIVRTGTVPKD